MAEPAETGAGAVAEALPEPGFKIVGIGASAGGLSALMTLLGNLPADPGVALVVIMHLAPDRESRLGELLAARSPLPVAQVTSTVALEADHVYVIPPNANLNSIDTHLRLSDLEARRADRAPIDHFFRTLAETHGANAMGVVLTGGGSDGTLGLRSIREQGGVTLAQNPEEAEHDSMPRSAIASGMVDRVLALADIAGEIVRFARTRPGAALARGEPPRAIEEQEALSALYDLMHERTGHDLTRYRDATILRRLHRRMQLLHVETLADYVALVREHEHEARALFDDLLITVTEFFRDPDVYAALARDAIPQLFAGKTAPPRLRVWSIGCSTGEEAYSVAILLLEEADRRQVEPEIQVFASDLHEVALRKAREGIYPEEIAADVSAERLQRFFVYTHGRYRVRSEVRERVVFAAHNLLQDPPFSHMDMVVCRNLLMYLKREAQQEVFELLHYALEPGGLLLLGTSEALDRTDLFEPVDDHQGLFRRRPGHGRLRRLEVRAPAPGAAPRRRAASPCVSGDAGGAHERVVERFAPPSVLVGDDDQIVHYSARAGQFLQVPGGSPTHGLYDLVREPVASELRLLVAAARRRGRPGHSRPLTLATGGGARRVVISVRPATDPDLAGLLLVIFDEQDEAPEAPSGPAQDEAAPPAADEAAAQRVADLQAAQQELLSANEELRAMIGELSASQEALQSANEELSTVNQESARRLAELDKANADLAHFHAATRIPTLFLDRELRIVRFTIHAADLFNLRPGDSGRPLMDLTNRLDYPDLIADARAVLGGREQVEREVSGADGCWYLVRMLPYRNGGGEAEGVVITLVDITDRRRAEQEALEALKARDYAESIIETIHEPLVVLHRNLTVKDVNGAFCAQFRVTREETLGCRIYDLGNRQWDIPELRLLLEDVLPDNDTFDDYLVTHEFQTIGRRVMLLNARRLDHVPLILLGIRDITHSHDAERALRANEARFRELVNASSFVVYRMSPDWTEMRELDGRGFIRDTQHPNRDWLEQYIDAEDQPRVLAAIDEAIRGKHVFELEHRVRRVDGTLGWTLSRAVPLLDEHGEIREWFGAASDVSARHEAEGP